MHRLRTKQKQLNDMKNTHCPEIVRMFACKPNRREYCRYVYPLLHGRYADNTSRIRKLDKKTLITKRWKSWITCRKYVERKKKKHGMRAFDSELWEGDHLRVQAYIAKNVGSFKNKLDMHWNMKALRATARHMREICEGTAWIWGNHCDNKIITK